MYVNLKLTLFLANDAGLTKLDSLNYYPESITLMNKVGSERSYLPTMLIKPFTVLRFNVNTVGDGCKLYFGHVDKSNTIFWANPTTIKNG